MIFNETTVHQLKSASDVKYALDEKSYFFTRKTMKFFGDSMRSFGVRTFNGKRYLYRKPTAAVNVFGRWTTAGKQFFNVWEIVPHFDHVKLETASEETKENFYNSL